jgi:hypothetical protein
MSVQRLTTVTYAVVLFIDCVAQHPRDHRHGLDTNDSFDCQIGLVRESSSEIICANLIRGNEGFRDKVSGPLVEKVRL